MFEYLFNVSYNNSNVNCKYENLHIYSTSKRKKNYFRIKNMYMIDFCSVLIILLNCFTSKWDNVIFFYNVTEMKHLQI